MCVCVCMCEASASCGDVDENRQRKREQQGKWLRRSASHWDQWGDDTIPLVYSFILFQYLLSFTHPNIDSLVPSFSDLPSWPFHDFSLPYLLLLSPPVPFSPHLLPLFLTCSHSSSLVPSLPPVPSLPRVFPLSLTCCLFLLPVLSVSHQFLLFPIFSLSSASVTSLPKLFLLLLICILSPLSPFSWIPLLFSHWLTSSCQFSGDLHWCGVPAHGSVVVDQISWIHARLVFPLSSVSHLLYFLHMIHTKVKIVPDKSCFWTVTWVTSQTPPWLFCLGSCSSLCLLMDHKGNTVPPPIR